MTEVFHHNLISIAERTPSFDEVLQQLAEIHRKEIEEASRNSGICTSCKELRNTFLTYRENAENLLKQQEQRLEVFRNRIRELENVDVHDRSQDILCPDTPGSAKSPRKRTSGGNKESRSGVTIPPLELATSVVNMRTTKSAGTFKVESATQHAGKLGVSPSLLNTKLVQVAKSAELKKRLGSPVHPEKFGAVLPRVKLEPVSPVPKCSTKDRKVKLSSPKSSPSRKKARQSRLSDRYFLSIQKTRVKSDTSMQEWREKKSSTSEDFDLTPSIIIPPDDNELPVVRKPLSPRNKCAIKSSPVSKQLPASTSAVTSPVFRCTPDIVALNITTDSDERDFQNSPSLMRTKKCTPSSSLGSLLTNQKRSRVSPTNQASPSLMSTNRKLFLKQDVERATNGNENRDKQEKDVVEKVLDSPVRKRAERMLLPGHDCKDCKKFYEMAGIDEEQRRQLIQKCSRHRTRFSPPPTPKGFWDLDIPDTPELRRRGLMEPTQKCDLVGRRK